MRIIYLIILIFLSLTWVPWFVAPFVFLYALKYIAFELLVVAVLIDVYAGTAITIPYYTLGVTVLIMVAELVKPNIRINNF